MSTTVREIMSGGADCVRTDQTTGDAARLMASLNVGALPICGPDNKIKGVLTDRDIITKVIARGRDVGTFPAGDLNQQEAATVGADDTPEHAITVMRNHQIRRLPVIDNGDLVGMLTLADLAQEVDHARIGELVNTLSLG